MRELGGDKGGLGIMPSPEDLEKGVSVVQPKADPGQDFVPPLPSPVASLGAVSELTLAEHHPATTEPPAGHIWARDVKTEKPTCQACQDRVVVFSDGDPDNPRNWPKWKRWLITVWAALLILANTWTSSAPTGSAEVIMQHYGVGRETFELVLSLYLLGYVACPLIMAPLSEQYGRRPIFIISGFFFAVFNAGSTASGDSFAGMLVCRFLAAALGSAPMSNAGSMIGDIWSPQERGLAMLFYSLGPWMGPSCGPLAGGYLSVYGYRWIFIVQTIVATVMFAGSFLLLPETYGPRILQKRAKRLRKETGDPAWTSPLDIALRDEVDWQHRVTHILGTPAKMMILEPTVYLSTLYLSVCYAIIYALFESYPIIFTELRGLSPGRTGITFLFVLAGCLLSIPATQASNNTYLKAVKAALAAGKKPQPELRLPPALWGAPISVVGLLWLGWSGYKSEVIWVVPALSGIPLGFGTMTIFRVLQNYMVDVYGDLSASALAGMVTVRSVFGAAIPLFGTQMYHSLGIEWASTLLAALMAILAPVPLWFLKYGGRIREKSHYARYTE